MRSSSWRWIWGVWIAYGLCDACQTVLSMHAEGKHHPWFPIFATDVQILHGSDSELQLTRPNSAGVEVLVTLPFKVA
jgi:hypothetical protein